MLLWSLSLISKLKNSWWTFTLLFVLMFPFGLFTYSKYLDKRNVQDMKTLLSDFQQLEKDMEEETGEEFTIEADCSSVGKFATSYSCSVYFKNATWKEVYSQKVTTTATKGMKNFGGCEMLSENSIGFSPNEDMYLCTFTVRSPNEVRSEQIFYDYDESPGSPY